MMPEITFDDRADAEQYLSDLGWLWGVWLASLVAITFSSGGMRALTGLVGLGLTVWRTGPLNRRARELVPDEEARIAAGFRGGPRERTFRKLAYGEAPLRTAVETAHASPAWFAARVVMLAVTVLGFAAVVVSYVS